MKYILALLILIGCKSNTKKVDRNYLDSCFRSEVIQARDSILRHDSLFEVNIDTTMITYKSWSAENFITFPKNPSTGQRVEYIFAGNKWVDISDSYLFPPDTTINYQFGNDIVLIRITRHIIHAK